MGTELNSAGIMTKHVDQHIPAHHLHTVGLESRHYDIGDSDTHIYRAIRVLATSNARAQKTFKITTQHVTVSSLTIHWTNRPTTHYSRTQATIATSSGEAEQYAIVSGVNEGIGILSSLKDSDIYVQQFNYCFSPTRQLPTR